MLSKSMVRGTFSRNNKGTSCIRIEDQRTLAFKEWADEYQTMREIEEILKGVVSWKGKQKTISSKR